MPYNPKYNKHQAEYRKEKFKRIGVDFDKEYYNSTLKPAADAEQMPIGTFIKKCINDYIDRRL